MIRAEQLEQCLQIFDSAAATGAGRVVFLSGDPGSGKSDTLRALSSSLLGRSESVVLAGGFRGGEYHEFPSDASRNGSPDILATLFGAISTLEPTTAPIIAILRQIIQASGTAAQLLSDMKGRKDRFSGSLDAFRSLVRAAAREQTVACVLDDLDHSNSDWLVSVLVTFAGELEKDLKVVFYLGLEDPVDRLLPEEEAGGLGTVARHLVAGGIGTLLHLKPLTRDEIATWIGDPGLDVARTLLKTTNGNPRWIELLWHHWLQSGTASRPSNHAPWELLRPEDDLATVDDVLGEKLLRALGTPSNVQETLHILALASLEGREFTANAIAELTGQDSDALIDFLDDKLVEIDSRTAILIESAHVETTTTTLWRYKFKSELDWLTIRR